MLNVMIAKRPFAKQKTFKKVIKEDIVIIANKAEMIKNLICDILEPYGTSPSKDIVIEGNRVCGNYPTWALRLAEDLIFKGWRK